jgi:molybdopterin converting factor small subunit
MVRVVFPAQFQQLLKGELDHQGAGANLREVLASICAGKPDLQKVLFLASGEVSPFVAFSVMGANDIFPATLSGSVALKPGDAVEVILAMAGG